MAFNEILKFLLFLEDEPKHRVLVVHSWMTVAIVFAAWLLSWGMFVFLLPYGLIALILGVMAVPVVLVEALHLLCDR